MTLLELKNVIKSGTDFYLKSENRKFKIANILWGCEAFSSIQVGFKSVSFGNGCVFVETDMPENVFNAWKDYGKGD